MPTNVRIIHAHDFIRATPEGRLDLQQSKQLLLEIASVPAPSGPYEIMVDTRKAQIETSVFDLWRLAAELASVGAPLRRRIAVLCPTEGFDRASFFALCAQNQGFEVSAFTSFEEAMGWLTHQGNAESG